MPLRAKDAAGVGYGAIGGAAGALLNTTLDANGNIPAPLDVAMTTMVGGLLAGALGTNAQGAATAAENETLNNWLSHVRPGPMTLSEQEQADSTGATCSSTGDATACSTSKSLQALSQQRDADLANACAGGFSSPGCRAQVAAALAGGNDVQPVNGTMYAFDPNGPAIKSIPNSYSTTYSGSFDGMAAQSLADALPLTPIGIGDIAAGLQALKGLGSTLFGTGVLDAGIQWGKGIMGQGMPWEDFLATQMPSASRLPPNFKTFDFFDPASGSATSAKTLDTTTQARLANPTQVYSSLKTSIDAAANFPGYELSGVSLTPDMISSRSLQVAVPSATTPAQWQQINNAVQYGASKGVKVTVTVTK